MSLPSDNKIYLDIATIATALFTNPSYNGALLKVRDLLLLPYDEEDIERFSCHDDKIIYKEEFGTFKSSHEINDLHRPNHGLAHAVRLSILVYKVAMAKLKYRTDFPSVIKKKAVDLAIVALFFKTGRKCDMGRGEGSQQVAYDGYMNVSLENYNAYSYESKPDNFGVYIDKLYTTKDELADILKEAHSFELMRCCNIAGNLDTKMIKFELILLHLTGDRIEYIDNLALWKNEYKGFELQEYITNSNNRRNEVFYKSSTSIQYLFRQLCKNIVPNKTFNPLYTQYKALRILSQNNAKCNYLDKQITNVENNIAVLNKIKAKSDIDHVFLDAEEKRLQSLVYTFIESFIMRNVPCTNCKKLIP